MPPKLVPPEFADCAKEYSATGIVNVNSKARTGDWPPAAARRRVARSAPKDAPEPISARSATPLELNYRQQVTLSHCGQGSAHDHSGTRARVGLLFVAR
jgi:hypothetical protein